MVKLVPNRKGDPPDRTDPPKFMTVHATLPRETDVSLASGASLVYEVSLCAALPVMIALTKWPPLLKRASCTGRPP